MTEDGIQTHDFDYEEDMALEDFENALSCGDAALDTFKTDSGHTALILVLDSRMNQSSKDYLQYILSKHEGRYRKRLEYRDADTSGGVWKALAERTK